MRQLFFVLVLANLGVAAWSAWFAPLTRVGHRADEGLPSITLLREVPADLRSSGVVAPSVVAAADAAGVALGDPPEAGDPAVPPPDAVPVEVDPASIIERPADAEPPVADLAAGVATCKSVGPFRELSQAANAMSALRAMGFEPAQRVAEGDIWIGYWVYIGAIPSEAEANAILTRMREQGIADSYVIPNSDSGNLVSLGVFSEISGVSRRRDQVRALGLEPQVVDRTRRATVYWVDVSLGSEQTLDFDALQPPGRIIRLEQRPCDLGGD